MSSLLDRVQRAAEVWQLRAEAYADRHAARIAKAACRVPAARAKGGAYAEEAEEEAVLVRRGAGSDKGGVGDLDDAASGVAGESARETPRDRVLARRSELETYASARISSAGNHGGSPRAANRAAASTSTSGVASSGKQSSSSKRPRRRMARLLRLVGLTSPLHESSYLHAKALVARALALAIRRARPDLPPTPFEASKVAYNPSVANAMLEAYARALATHSEAAVRFYRRVAANGPHTDWMPPAMAMSPAMAMPHASTLASMASTCEGGTCEGDGRMVSRAPAPAAAPSAGARVSAVTFAEPSTNAPTSANISTETLSAAPVPKVGGMSLKLDLGKLKLPASGASTAFSDVSERDDSTRSSRADEAYHHTPGTPTRASAQSSSSSRSSHAIPSRYKWQIKMSEVKLLTRLGAGAYGEVYAGRWRRNEVAVKQMNHGELSAVDREAFFGEMQILSDLRRAYWP